MRTIKRIERDNGTVRVILELAPGESLLVIDKESHYKLGHPVEDVVASHVLADTVLVHWCSVEQRWLT